VYGRREGAGDGIEREVKRKGITGSSHGSIKMG